MPRLRYEVFGHVQGVGFRMTTTDVAYHIGALTGYVRNTTHGTVEGEVQGSRDKLHKFIKAIEASPAGRVDRIDTHEVDEKQEEDDAGRGGFRATS